MPSSSSSGSSTRRRSIRSASWGRSFERPRSEDRPGTVENRARMAGGIHRQAAAWAQGAPCGQQVFRLFRESDDLLVAEPEANARGVLGLRLLAGGGLAGYQDEHLACFVVAETHLADLPLGLPGREPSLAGNAFRALDPLGFEHLVEANDQSLDLGLLARERQGASPPFGEQEEAPLAGFPDGSHSDVIDRIELEDGHWSKGTVSVYPIRALAAGAIARFDAVAAGKRIKVNN